MLLSYAIEVFHTTKTINEIQFKKSGKRCSLSSTITFLWYMRKEKPSLQLFLLLSQPPQVLKILHKQNKKQKKTHFTLTPFSGLERTLHQGKSVLHFKTSHCAPTHASLPQGSTEVEPGCLFSPFKIIVPPYTSFYTCKVFLYIIHIRDTKIITSESFLSALYARIVMKAMFKALTKQL